MIPKRNSSKDWLKEKISTEKDPIKTSATTKILGSVINNTLTNDSEVNTLNSHLHEILRNLKKLGKKSTMQIRLQLVNAAFMGRMQYLIPT